MEDLIKDFNTVHEDLMQAYKDQKKLPFHHISPVITRYLSVIKDVAIELNSNNLTPTLTSKFDYNRLWEIVKTIGDDILVIISLLSA
jgi:hypothetical protein